ncbi:MAG: diaminopimelate decarboxylase [Clostridia bacterium]
MNTRDTLYIENGELFVGNLSATSLAKRFGTPLYVMDATYIASVCDAYSQTMSAYGGAVLYTSKAFATIATTKLIASHGLWFDAVSGGELFLLNSANVDMKHVVFHGNNKTPKEILEGVELGVGYFVIDSDTEIDTLDKIACENGIKQDVLIRVNPGVTAHTHAALQTAAPASKFGFAIDEQAEETVKYILSKPNLTFKGLHMHIGSQVYEHSSYEFAVDAMCALIKRLADCKIAVDIFDIGGGFGIYYNDEDPLFTPKRYSYTLKQVCENVKTDCAKYAVKMPFLIFEPGRSVVGEAGVTLYTVGAIKNFPNVKKYVAVDGGMFENPRHALYDAHYEAVVANHANKPKSDIVTLVGKCCESGDIVASDIPLQEAEVGDIVAVFSTGAYNYSMASNYNLNPVPPVVLVDGEKADYIVKPQTYEDLTRNNTVPEWI